MDCDTCSSAVPGSRPPARTPATESRLLRAGVGRDNTDADKASGAKTSRPETALHADKAYGIPELRRWLRGVTSASVPPSRAASPDKTRAVAGRPANGRSPAFPATAGRCLATLGLAGAPRCRSASPVLADQFTGGCEPRGAAARYRGPVTGPIKPSRHRSLVSCVDSITSEWNAHYRAT